MKIAHSTVALQSQHASASFSSRETIQRSWVGNQRPDFEGRRARSPAQGVALSLSAQALARAHFQAQPSTTSDVAAPDAVSQANDAVRNDPRLRMLMDMVKAITGRDVVVFDERALRVRASPVAAAGQVPHTQTATNADSGAPEGWGLEIDTHEVQVESEITQVNAQGVVRTADGQQIHFTLQLEMSRTFVQESNTSVRAGDAVRKDPLVINFNGAGVALTDQQFAFDLNADGATENIAMVTGGSGFLALDRNADGRVNDGSELFGTRSGDGFADLAQFDQDGNQWIDENDAVYSQLRVWQRDASGQDSLSTLAQSGVGALYTGRVASPFSVNTATNQTMGLVRSTGVFLYASGQAGSLQQVDL
jgi:hypothetical protein